jgi:hypothetical protein
MHDQSKGIYLGSMEPQRTDELVAEASRAIMRRDSRALRSAIARLGEHVSPRLTLLAVAAAQALDAGDVVLALQYFDPYAEACRASVRSTQPVL